MDGFDSKNPYAILGLEQGHQATADDIRKVRPTAGRPYRHLRARQSNQQQPKAYSWTKLKLWWCIAGLQEDGYPEAS
jgi:hypothetical protein